MTKEIKRNCNSCRCGLLSNCKTLKESAEYQLLWEGKYSIKKSLAADKWKENFICDDYKCRYIQYPLTINGFSRNDSKDQFISNKSGKFVKIRPCSDGEQKTYLGLMIGDLPTGIHVSLKEDSGVVSLGYMTNPAIFVFDLNKIVYGMESWWGVIESEEDLKEISDLDIDNVWYVKAMNQLQEQGKEAHP